MLELEINGTDIDDDMDISNYLPKTDKIYDVTKKQQVTCDKLLDKLMRSMILK